MESETPQYLDLRSCWRLRGEMLVEKRMFRAIIITRFFVVIAVVGWGGAVFPGGTAAETEDVKLVKILTQST